MMTKRCSKFLRLKLRNQNAGFSLIELMVTLSILSILTYFTIPYYNNIVQQQDLKTAKNRIIHSLQKAKRIANAENTFVEVSISDNIIQLKPKNRNNVFSIKIPGRITTDSDVSFTFKSTGAIYRAGGESIDSITNIKINPKSNSSLFETISISNSGIISIL